MTYTLDKKKNKTKKKKNFFLITSTKKKKRKKKKIGDDVHIGQLVTPFQSVGKSAAIDNTASDFDDANLNVKKK